MTERVGCDIRAVMHLHQYLVPVVIVATQITPSWAQAQELTVEGYIQTQQALIGGVAELLRLPTIAEDPNDVAVAIGELSKYAAALVSMKGQLDAAELAAAQAQLEYDPSAQAVGAAFVSEVNKLNEVQFYNCTRLAAAIQHFAALLARM